MVDSGLELSPEAKLWAHNHCILLHLTKSRILEEIKMVCWRGKWVVGVRVLGQWNMVKK